MDQCKGANCSSTDGRTHSIECIQEHNSAVYAGAGNRHPEFRYRGYTKEPLQKNATDDQEAAWREGYNAREDT